MACPCHSLGWWIRQTPSGASEGLELTRWVLSGGATDSSAGAVSLRATLGQPMAGVVSANDITLEQGPWHGGSLSGGG